MVTLAHITDPHLPLSGTGASELACKRLVGWLSWTFRRRRNHKREILDRIMADVAASNASHIVLTGDLVNISTRAEFDQAEAWLRQTAGPELLSFIPGNHDCYVRGAVEAGLVRLAPWMRGDNAASAPASAGMPAFPYVRYRRNVAIIGVNSAWPAPWREASGLVGEAQLAALAELLTECAAKGLCRVVLIHHPPLPGMTIARKALKDAEALGEVLRERGAELVLFGHNHAWVHRPLKTATGTAHLLAAPSTSMAIGRKKPPGGWQLLRISRRKGMWSVQVERRGLDGASGEVRMLETLELTSRD